ncbi:MAG: SUMF1/EgtB/PvdO family nonheme iron enzyme, partial [Planctomycetales bacterium]|nr:SUMF1/EgtB/PvdO family nonheme iron enzyme [Planctomycetales bacterium]
DIKPSNLLLAPDGRLSINDFGLARIMEDPGVTATGEVLGSPRYMSPEQVSPKHRALDHRTDIYSLGATLYELLTLRPPFDGDTPERILSQVLHEQPIAPRRIDSRIPTDLETICRKAMQKDPADRYQTAAEMSDDLNRFVRRRAITARRIGPIGHAWRWCQRNRAVATLSFLLINLVLSGTALLSWQRISRVREEERLFQESLGKITVLSEAGNHWTALERIHAAWRDFPTRRNHLAEAMNRVGPEFTIDSDPPGAEISIRPALGDTHSWLRLGTTPLVTRLPSEHLYVKAVRDGSEELITLQNAQHEANDKWLLKLPTYEGMRRIPPTWHRPGSDECRIVWLLSRQLPQMDEFHVDHHEVTNAEFKRFVDDGGYRRAEFWTGTLGDAWQQTVDREFRDTTDEVGPAFWRGGTYPEGLSAYPVVGVSWHEAMAYATWAGKSLPTLFHHLRAAEFTGWYVHSDLANRQNIANRLGTLRSTHDGELDVNQFGIIAIVGNVKEWCLNEQENGTYYAMGSSFRDPTQSQEDPVGVPAMERRDDVGFRCASYPPRPALTESLPVRWRTLPNETRPIEPYRKLFAYDRSVPLNVSQPQSVKINGVSGRHVEFDTVYGPKERMTCYVVLPDPKRFKPPYQVVLADGRIVLDSEGKPNIAPSSFFHLDYFRRGGRALVISSILGKSFDRKSPEFPSYFPDAHSPEAYTQWVVKRAQDFSRTVDLVQDYNRLFDENLLDGEKLAFCATGDLNAACWLVADHHFVANKKRFLAAVFLNGGIVNCEQPMAVDQVTYLPWLDTPTLMLGSMRRSERPYQTSQKPMYELLPLVDNETKRNFVFPNYVYGFPLEHFDREVNAWLNRWLGNPNRVGTN